MFTSLDKAIVAAIMGVLYIINALWGINIGVSEATLSAIIGAITPILVYIVPNKKTT
jgi:hypothetical protein